MDFLKRLIASDFWEWISTVMKHRQEAILKQLGSVEIGADARAMLTGRLIEDRFFENFPVNSLQFYKGMEQQTQDEKRENIIPKTVFPDITTH